MAQVTGIYKTLKAVKVSIGSVTVRKYSEDYFNFNPSAIDIVAAYNIAPEEIDTLLDEIETAREIAQRLDAELVEVEQLDNLRVFRGELIIVGAA